MALDKRQKFLLPLVVIAFAYVGWQIYSMTNNTDNSTPQTATPVKKAVAVQPDKNLSKVTAANNIAGTSGSIQTPTAIASREQTQYLQLLNQYQLLKMKRMLLEEEVAIAGARQKIAELNSQTSKLGGSVDYSDTDAIENVSANNVATVPANVGNYAVVYIDHQDGQWNATLNNRGHFEEATIGSILSDGSKVVAINASGVVLSLDNRMTKLTFSGPVAVDAKAATDDMDEENDDVMQDADDSKANSVKTDIAPIAVEKKITAPKRVLSSPVIEPKKDLPSKVKEEKQSEPVAKPEVKKPESKIEPKKDIAPIVKEEKKVAPIVKPEVKEPEPKIESKQDAIPVVKEEKKLESVAKFEVKAKKPVVELKNDLPAKPTIVTKSEQKNAAPVIIINGKSPSIVHDKQDVKKLDKKGHPVKEVKKEVAPQPIEAKMPQAPVTQTDDMKNLLNMLEKNNPKTKDVSVVNANQEVKAENKNNKIIPDVKVNKPVSETKVITNASLKPVTAESNEIRVAAPVAANPVPSATKLSATPVSVVNLKPEAPKVANTAPVVVPVPTVATKPIENNVPNLPPVSGKPDHYALQLMGGEEVADINDFVKANKLDNAVVYKTSHNGKDWYVLVYGKYKSSADANSAIKTLSPDLAELNPWIRPIYTKSN